MMVVTTLEPPPRISPTTTKTIEKILSSNSSLSLLQIKQTHAQTIKTGLHCNNYTAGALVKLYATPQHGCFHVALKVFDQVPHPHVFLWNSTIRACVENMRHKHAMLLYSSILVHGSIPNKYTYPLLFKASCGLVGDLGKQMHTHVLKLGFWNDRFVRSSLIHMYVCFGMVSEAHKVFGVMTEMDPVCWNSMIDGYVRCGNLEMARKLFDEMPRRNVGSWNAMISGYAKQGMIESSRELFDAMPKRDEVSWSAMIDGYLQCDLSREALTIFDMMQREGVAPKKFVLSSVLAACADVGALEQGKWVHAYISRKLIPIDAVLGTSLIDMYAKCGCLDLAEEVFEKMPNIEIFTWNAMINGFAIHGHVEKAFEVLSRMKNEEVQPNSATFVSVLNACAHAGLVEDGYKYFHSMQKDYNISPMMEHYGCMVDLLGRAGRLNEAESMIKSMSCKPNAAIWGALLGACKIHNDVVLGEEVANILLELEPQNSGRYTLLSNMYARAERWDDVSRIRKLMKDRGVRTIPGTSLIEFDGAVHEFVVGGGSHPMKKEICSMLDQIFGNLELEGHVPETSQVLFDIDEEEKEMALKYHSEKLAVAFGLIRSKPKDTIRVVKNLRMCEDCHAVMKLISRVYGREILVRDRVRFHCFTAGMCSCKDFW